MSRRRLWGGASGLAVACLYSSAFGQQTVPDVVVTAPDDQGRAGGGTQPPVTKTTAGSVVGCKAKTARSATKTETPIEKIPNHRGRRDGGHGLRPCVGRTAARPDLRRGCAASRGIRAAPAFRRRNARTRAHQRVRDDRGDVSEFPRRRAGQGRRGFRAGEIVVVRCGASSCLPPLRQQDPCRRSDAPALVDREGAFGPKARSAKHSRPTTN